MKKFFSLLVFIPVIFLSACAHSFYLGMQVNTPKIGMFGIGTYSTISVFNPTPYDADLYALNDVHVGNIPPNGSIWDKINVKFEGEDYPLVAWLHDKNGNTVGVSFITLHLSQDSPANWTIQQVYYPDGRWTSYSYNNGVSPYPPTTTGESGRVNFPTIDLGTSTYVQFINCTYYVVEGRLGARGLTMPNMPSMTSFTLPYRNFTRIEGNIPVNLLYKFNGNLVMGWQNVEFFVNSGNTPRAIQLLLLPSNIQQAPH